MNVAPTKVDHVKARGTTGKLASVRELSLMLHVSRARAYQISNHWSFPQPLDVLGADSERPMAVWWMKDVRKWIEENRPEDVTWT